MPVGIKEFCKRLSMKEQVKLIEDSIKPGFKQSKTVQNDKLFL